MIDDGELKKFFTTTVIIINSRKPPSMYKGFLYSGCCFLRNVLCGADDAGCMNVIVVVWFVVGCEGVLMILSVFVLVILDVVVLIFSLIDLDGGGLCSFWE